MNRALPSLHGGWLEIMLTVPVRYILKKIIIKFTDMDYNDDDNNNKK